MWLNLLRSERRWERSCPVTPDLAGFTTAGDNVRSWDGISAAVIAALATEFDVQPERRGAGTLGADRRTTWLDTFDWRLYKAGPTLEDVPRRRGGERQLCASRPGAPDSAATQLVTGWQASRPHLAADLAAGPVSARIAALVAPRALLPVVTASTATLVYRLLNADGKTVARLLVTRPSLAGQEPLPPRIAVAEVRGYLGQARRAARLVAAVPGVKAAAGPLFADALRAIGRRPGDYSNKVDAAITGAMPAGAAAAAILLRLLDTIDANVAGVLADPDTEFLHDLRVSVRRSRSALKLFGDVLSTGSAGPAGLTAADVAFFAAELKWVGDL